MTVRFLKVMISLGGLLAFAAAACAQTEVVTVRVPFAFQAGGTLLPAGDYRVSKADGSNILLMHGGPGASAAFLTMSVDTNASEEASLVFSRQGGSLVLSTIRLPGRESRVLLPSHTAMKASVAASVSAASTSSR